MMLRGIDIPSDPLKKERMIQWYIEEQLQDYYRTLLIAAASKEGIDISNLERNYRNSLFPTDKINEELIEKHKELIEEEADKEYDVKELDMFGRFRSRDD